MFINKYLEMHKVQKHAGAITKLLYGFVSVRTIITSLKLVDYLLVQVHQPYNEKYLNYSACLYEHSKFLLIVGADSLLYLAGNTERIIQGLEKVTDLNIYRKGSAALQQLHYNDNERIHPIVLVGNEGVVIVNNATKSKITSGKFNFCSAES